MTKKQNLMLDLPNLDEQDLLHISWWLDGGYSRDLPLAIDIIALTDKQKLHVKALTYFQYKFHWESSVTQNTYKKLFGEYRC